MYALQRVVLPVSGLASWLLVAAGGLMTLHVLGINIAPLLTVGGVSGIIVGLSAQSVMSNMISGINLVRTLSHTGAEASALAARRQACIIATERQLKGSVLMNACPTSTLNQYSKRPGLTSLKDGWRCRKPDVHPRGASLYETASKAMEVDAKLLLSSHRLRCQLMDCYDGWTRVWP